MSFALPLFAFHLHIFSFVIFFMLLYVASVNVSVFFSFRLSFKIFNLYSTEFLWKTAEKTFPGFKLRTESFLGKLKHKSLQDVRNFICI